ncbi:MAG TPA: sensor histidine kinase [Solirubrobacteraceae bacterium]|nr:sensor histidine kinase [Solirubrobacteraceae bacterium]
MIGLKRALALLGALGAVLTVLGVLIALNTEHIDGKIPLAFFSAAIMGSYIGVGLSAWWRRPRNRIGALMTAAGFSAFFLPLSAANSSLFYTIGATLGSIGYIIVAHLVLAFPTGRLETASQRRLIAASYALGIGAPLLFLMFEGDCDCDSVDGPRSAFLITESPGFIRILDPVVGLLGVTLTALMVRVLVRRWRAATPHARRALAPVLWTGTLLVATLLFTLAFDALGDMTDEAESVVDLVGIIVVTAVPYAYVLGLARSRSWRAEAMTDVVAGLGGARSDLQAVLTDALGDPSLEVAYWLPERGVHVGADGLPVLLPAADDPLRSATDVRRDGVLVGALIHDRALCDEPDILAAVANGAALALDHQRLDAELRARVEELRESRQRILEVGLAERRRLERDLHDGAQQRLVSLSLQLGLVTQQLDRGGTDAARELLDGARGEARAALEDLRELARGIHPAVLTDRGLGPALEALADRATVPVDLQGLPDERLPWAVEAAAYFVVSESLTNVAKYARATHAEVRVGREHGWALVEVADDGVGGADPSSGSGLRGLADRLAALDGRLEIESAEGRGTTVRARIPCR